MKRLVFDLCQAGYCEHPEVVTLKGGSMKSCQFPSLFGFFEHPDEGLILYDTGYHPLYTQQKSLFPEGLYPRMIPAVIDASTTALAQVKAKGYSADDVRFIVLSHFHGDHVAGLRDFPKAKILSLKSAFDAVDGKSRFRNLLNGYLPALLPDDFLSRVSWIEDCAKATGSVLSLPHASYDVFGDGSMVAIELPGHKAGQIGLVFQGETQGPCFLVADAAWSRTAITELRPPQWIATKIMDDRGIYLRTLRELHDLSLRQPELTLIPSHCRKTFQELKGIGS